LLQLVVLKFVPSQLLLYQSRKQQAAISTEEDEVPAPLPMPTTSSSVLLTLE
jgi:hypothetical protein